MTVVTLPANARLIDDPDTEVFLLYTRLASLSSADGSQPFRGLGFIDSREDTLAVRFELDPIDAVSNLDSGKGRSKRTRKPLRRAGAGTAKTVEFELAQDKTALHSRKGDTGSVLWQASVDFARHILQQHHARGMNSLLSFDNLSTSTVLELGSGTGLLAVALSPLCRKYIATDIPELVPLISKNIELNHERSSAAQVTAAESLDWTIVHDTPPAKWYKLRLLPGFPGHRAGGPAAEAGPGEDDVDLVLVTDCIYHPSLVPPLVSTLEYLGTRGGRLAADASGHAGPDVLVVAELRAEDVVREFLECWCALDGWTVWSLNTGDSVPGEDTSAPSSLSGANLGPRYAVWLGRKQIQPVTL